MKKSLIAILALSLSLSACGKEDQAKENTNQSQNTDQDQTKQKEELVNDIYLEDRDGNPVSLDEYKGKKTYVEFWASWCPVCISSLDQFDELSKNADDYNILSVVSPGLLGEMPKDEFIEWFDGLGHENIEVLYDTKGEFIDEFVIRSTPTNIFINSDGEVEKVVAGQMPEDMLEEFLAEID